MERTLVIRGRYAGRKFIPEGPLPDAEGTAELVITPTPDQGRATMAPTERTAGLHRGALDPSADFDAPLSDDFWAGNQ